MSTTNHGPLSPARRRHESTDSTSVVSLTGSMTHSQPETSSLMGTSSSLNHSHHHHNSHHAYELPLLGDDNDDSSSSNIPTNIHSSGSKSKRKSVLTDSQMMRKLQRQRIKLQHQFPQLKYCLDGFHRLPKSIKMSILVIWLIWKLTITLLVLYYMIFPFGTAAPTQSQRMENPIVPQSQTQQEGDSSTIKILYIVTSLAEYNTGTRATKKGQDRLGEVMLPVLVDSVEQILTPPTSTTTTIDNENEQQPPQTSSSNYSVDVYLILHYELKPERKQLIQDRLPPNVGLEIWDDASPLGYDKSTDDSIKENTRALARQHRYVIRDKLTMYDAFVVLEDDMRITQSHIQHYLQMSNEIDILQQQQQQRIAAPSTSKERNTKKIKKKKDDSSASTIQIEPMDDPYNMKFYGEMTSNQLKRLMPGFIRVEVLVDETTHGAQKKLDPVQVDFQFPISTQKDTNNVKDGSENSNAVDGSEKEQEQLEKEERHIDPQICCHVPNMKPNIETPREPEYQDIIIWETSIRALAVRQLASSKHEKNETSLTTSTTTTTSAAIDWVALLPGPGKRMKAEEKMGGFWSGRVNGGSKKSPLFDKDANYPTGGMPTLIAQQGGWIATQDQIYKFNDGLCMGNFLPPFDKDIYRKDGQEAMNVEFWSGGFQLFTGVKGGCNMQRVVSLDPNHFSKHLLYHVANNKQKQLAQGRMLRADNLFGQLNTVKKAAIQQQQQQQQQQQVIKAKQSTTKE